MLISSEVIVIYKFRMLTNFMEPNKSQLPLRSSNVKKYLKSSNVLLRKVNIWITDEQVFSD